LVSAEEALKKTVEKKTDKPGKRWNGKQ